uniref:Protein kinase domain-containing protein n=1 Tax=Lates calcarifer TaxID=8187 RepID=A0A4W6CU33_LATCA
FVLTGIVIKTGDILNGRYHVLDVLGEGCFGKVTKCEDIHTEQVVAIKTLKTQESHRHVGSGLRPHFPVPLLPPVHGTG